MLTPLSRRVAVLEKHPAFNWQAYFNRLTDAQLLAIAGTDCDGVPWSEFTDDELPLLAADDESVIETARARYLAKCEDLGGLERL